MKAPMPSSVARSADRINSSTIIASNQNYPDAEKTASSVHFNDVERCPILSTRSSGSMPVPLPLPLLSSAPSYLKHKIKDSLLNSITPVYMYFANYATTQKIMVRKPYGSHLSKMSLPSYTYGGKISGGQSSMRHLSIQRTCAKSCWSCSAILEGPYFEREKLVSENI